MPNHIKHSFGMAMHMVLSLLALRACMQLPRVAAAAITTTTTTTVTTTATLAAFALVATANVSPSVVDVCALPSQTGLAWEHCAQEHGGTACTCNGFVKYGAQDNWACAVLVTDQIECSNDAFGGDPHPNSQKDCFCLATQSLPDPTDTAGTVGMTILPSRRTVRALRV